MDFGEILGKSWKTIWKHKVLWIFGILAGCGANGGGSSGGGGGNNSINQSSSSWADPFDMFPQAQGLLGQIERFFENIQEETLILFVVGLIVLALLLSVLVLFLSSIGKAGLIYGASKADEMGEEAGKLNFKEVWNGGKPYFWRIVLLTLLVALAGIVLALVLILPAVLLSVFTLGIGLICILPLICIMIPVFWLLNVLIEQATVAIVLEDLGVFDSIKRAWQVVIQENLGSYIVLALILGIGGAIVGFVMALPLFLTMIPIVIGLVAGEGAIGGGIIAAVVIFLLYLPVLIVLSGILQAYIGSAWTLAFRRSATEKPEPADLDGDLNLLSGDTPTAAG